MPIAIDGSRRVGLGRLGSYRSAIRYRDIVALQGPPLLGAVFALPDVTAGRFVELLVLAIANLLLVAHIFVLNDWAGADADLNDANKRADAFATKGLSRRGIGMLWLALLALSLCLFAALGRRTLLFAVAIAILSALYSSPRTAGKSFPILGSALHLAGGMLHFLLGAALFRPVDGAAIAVASLCGLAFTAGHLTQEVRDFEGDRANGITTNAVVFGKRRTFIAGLAIFTAAYGQVVILAAVGIVPRWLTILGFLFAAHVHWSLEALAEGLSFDSICRLQARYRAIFAVIGVAILSTLLVSVATKVSANNGRMLEFSRGRGSLPPPPPLCPKPRELHPCLDRPGPSSA